MLNNLFKKFREFFQKKSYKLILIGVALVGLALISFYSVLLLNSLTDIEDGVVAVHLGIVQNAKNKIEGFLDENINALNDLAQILTLIETSQEKKMIIDRFLKERKSFAEVSLVSNQGQEILKRSYSLVFSPEDLEDISWSEGFVKAMEGEIYLSAVYASEKSVPFLTIAIPMESSPDQIAGVLIAELSLREVWQTISKIEVGQRGQVYLVDHRGYLIAHPNTYLVLKKTNLLTRLAIEKVIIEKEIVRGLEENEQYFNEKGEKVYVVGLPFEKIGWGVFAEEPINDCWSSYRGIRNLGLISILVAIVLFLILFFNIKTLANALRDLKKSKAALEESKATLEIKVSDKTEELRELTEGLEERVKERTIELQEKIEELEKFHRLAVGRELKMISLKEEIKKLKKRISKK